MPTIRGPTIALLLAYFCLLTTTTTIVAADKVPRPHGVSLAQTSLYQPRADGSWVCLDGRKVIRFVQVNDDFCDCADGSDEPGTAACSNGSFHCANIGHRAENIISSRVRDGICDCCDGSDEFVEGLPARCENTCDELGRAEQEQLRSRADLHRRGAARRAELIAKGKQMQAEREARRVELEQRRQEQETLKAEKQMLKEQAEALENEAVELWKAQQEELEAAHKQEQEHLLDMEAVRQAFSVYDGNKDGFVELAELQLDVALDLDRNGLVSEEEAKQFMHNHERLDFNSFATAAWPLIKQQQTTAPELPVEPTVERTHEEGIEPAEKPNAGNAETTHDREELEDEEAGEDEEGYEEEDADVGVGSVSDASPTPDYDPETQRLIDQANEARNAYNEVERVVRELEQEVKEIDDQNAKDYGLHEEYAALDGQCYNFEDREYVYTLCPFDRASQKQRNGHGETTLGRWHSWADAQGAEKYAQQKYMNGASCWNGPQRSVVVQLRCALEERITSVSEPNRCEYFFEFETPAACDNLDAQNSHDEL